MFYLTHLKSQTYKYDKRKNVNKKIYNTIPFSKGILSEKPLRFTLFDPASVNQRLKNVGIKIPTCLVTGTVANICCVLFHGPIWDHLQTICLVRTIITS